jgi:diguanylate cyclase (GGDEF)-like protein
MVINITDVSERHDYEEQLAFQTRHDALTGLANRGLFRERLERLVATIGSASVNSVLYIDLDDFKRINDTLCHQAGDDLLLAIGERLVALVRPEDLVDRLGSDEFAVLLESTDAHMAVAATKRILGALQRPLSLGGRDVLPRASVGIATTMPGGIGGDSLLGDADLAMYFAKRNGKAQYRVFSAEMRSDLVDRLQLGGISARRSSPEASRSITSRSSTCRAERSSVRRHLLAGIIRPEGGSALRCSSSRRGAQPCRAHRRLRAP